MADLVLSLFPGIGILDKAFEEEGFCVVRGPDLLWGGDIKRFHAPAGRFDGVIGGSPCQCFSRLVHIVRHNGILAVSAFYAFGWFKGIWQWWIQPALARGAT